MSICVNSWLAPSTMKPRTKLAETTNPDGEVMALFEQDGDYSISFKGQELMHSRANTSEILLGKIGVKRVRTGAPTRVLIGGLGLGFTLESVLSTVNMRCTVEVVEFIPAIVEWNREHLKELNNSALEDPRVEVKVKDARPFIRGAKPNTYDAIMLDLDNGPTAMVAEQNFSLYSNTGIRAIRTALKSRGRAVFWSAGPDPEFEYRLERLGFKVTPTPAKIHERAKRAAYMLYVADKKA